MKQLLTVLCFSFCTVLFAQNTYQYAVVPSSFDFLKEPNEHNLNELTKFLTQKQGMVTFYESENKSTAFNLADPCDVLHIKVSKEKAFLATKLKISVLDCSGNVITESFGSSKEKEFKAAYNYALRAAFDNLKIPSQKISKSVSDVTTSDVWIANKTADGYKVVDQNNVEKYTLYNTSRIDTFIASNGTINGVLIKDGSNWNLEYLKDQKVIKQTLKIRF